MTPNDHYISLVDYFSIQLVNGEIGVEEYVKNIGMMYIWDFADEAVPAMKKRFLTRRGRERKCKPIHKIEHYIRTCDEDDDLKEDLMRVVRRLR